MAAGYTQVTSSEIYSISNGLGWRTDQVYDFDFDPRLAVNHTDLTRDGNAVSNNDFLVDLANGKYDVTVTIGTASNQADHHSIYVALQMQDGPEETIRLDNFGVVAPTYRVTVKDGQLDVGLVDAERQQDWDAGLLALAITPVDTTEPPVQSAARYVTTDAATQGSWKGAYGSQGFEVALDPSANNPSLPVSTSMAAMGASSCVWDVSTSDPRALEAVEPGVTDPPAASWYSHTSFDIDISLQDGQEHQVALYLVDWAHQGLTETVQVLDSARPTRCSTLARPAASTAASTWSGGSKVTSCSG